VTEDRAGRILPALAVAVVARMALHALFLPAYEGPDEPHHLARILAFANGSLATAFAGREVSGEVVASVRAFPCAPAQARTYGCPAFGGTPAAFDLLRVSPPVLPADGTSNPESNQPPLFYFAAGMLLRPLHPAPAAALLAGRLFAVALVALALFGPLRTLARSRPSGLAVAGLLALLLPGACEALARCSNDAAVFFWAAAVLAALESKPGTARIALLLAAGPLLKLTAIPVVVFAAVALLVDGRRKAAVAGAACSLAVFPVQLLRGWRWGGTLELNRTTSAIGESFFAWVAGFLRSCAAFVKTTFWIGGWSFLRPPKILAVLYLVLIVWAILRWRPRPRPIRLAAHVSAIAVAAAGFCVFAIANRRLYGDWGGVAGWYLWDWSPWIAVAASDLGTIAPEAGRPLLWSEGLFVLAANVAWAAAHAGVYGL
jgi:hypothetical protein